MVILRVLMARHLSHIKSKKGFTLLEIILAVLIAALFITVAIPSVTSVFEGSKEQGCFSNFDAMVQEARARSMAEERNYVLVWGRDRTVLLRPEEPANEAEAEGSEMWKIKRGEILELHLPAALTEKGATPDAIWTFWSNGICEPAELRFKGAEGAWSATYNPFTAQAEVHYD